MKILLSVLVLVALTVSNTHPHLDPIITHVPKVYKVNVEDPPLVRWSQIVKDFQKPIERFMYFFDLIPFPKSFFKDVEWYARNQFKYQDFVAQVDAIATLGNFQFEKIFFMNFMYEYSTIKACTGILVRTDQGKIIHGRNLDFSMWQLLANMVANIHYYKDGKLLYTADTIVGSVFTLTAIRPGSFAVEVNTRTQAHFSDDFINVLARNAIPTCWLLKKVVEEESSYAAAVERLKTERIGGPVYFIVSGTKGNEGIVIERDNDKVHAAYELSETNWFLVQTNYDRDQPDPVHDQRRVPAETRLRERGNKNLKEQDLFDSVMSKYPTLNIESILTVVMVSSTGYHNTTVWYGENPVSDKIANLLVQ